MCCRGALVVIRNCSDNKTFENAGVISGKGKIIGRVLAVRVFT